MELSVDRVRCAGHGVCEALRPDVFELDSTGMVHVVGEIDEADRKDLEDAVHQCPEQALRLLG
ncbi:MAG: fdx 2 [Actinotalea sp.]|jgi:ferredoxin|nr:fdx 2 [Actinotalea sp.]